MDAALDELDERILDALKKDARATVVDLAKQTMAPRSTVAERIRRLRRAGVITAYTIRIDPRAVGKGQSAFVLIQVQPTPASEDVAMRLSRLEGVEETHIITGEWDIVLKLRGRDMPDLYEVHRRIVAVPGVGRVATFPCSKTVREP